MDDKQLFGGKLSKFLSGAALLLAASSGQAQAPAPNEPTRTFVNKSSFYLPINLDERFRSTLREVQLYVKDAPGKPWTLRERVPPTQTYFAFQEPRDGEYSFMVVTVDQAGRTNPAVVDATLAAMTVTLDTQAPQVEIAMLPASPEGQNISCQIRDANLDPMKTRLFYQTGDMVWRPLEAAPTKPDLYCIPAQARHTGMIRVLAGDLAGNTCAPIELNVATLALAPFRTGPASAPPESFAVVPPTPVKPAEAETTNKPLEGPALPRPTVLIEEKVVPVLKQASPKDNKPPVSNVPEVLPGTLIEAPNDGALQQISHQAPAPKAELRMEPAMPAWQIVNTTRVYLEYQVEATGASGVGKVEIWITRDKGQSWQRYGEDADRQSPAEINLPGEGLFGISLVLSNGRGFGANPPQSGEAPDHWIEVDITNPRADILSVRPTFGDEGGTLLISWTARDKNLAAEPIDLYHAASLDGPWTCIAKNLRNEGSYRWVTPLDLGHAYVRLIARDAAGNACQVHTPQSVATDDLSRPRGRVLGISTSPPNVAEKQ